MDAIGYRDKRFDPDTVSEKLTVQDLGRIGQKGMEEIRNLFEPIKKKCLGLLMGNHEMHLQLAKEQSQLHGWLCTELGVPNLGYSALFDVVFVRGGTSGQPVLEFKSPSKHLPSETFRFFVHHGAGFASTPGGKLNRLIQFMQSFDADIFLCGHCHDHVARKEPTIGCNATCTKLVQKVKLGVVAGSYLKTYTQGGCHPGYGEMRGYRPTDLGPAVVRITPETREMEAVV